MVPFASLRSDRPLPPDEHPQRSQITADKTTISKSSLDRYVRYFGFGFRRPRLDAEAELHTSLSPAMPVKVILVRSASVPSALPSKLTEAAAALGNRHQLSAWDGITDNHQSMPCRTHIQLRF